MVAKMNEWLLFVDEVLENHGLPYYSACELNRFIPPRAHSFPYNGIVVGGGKQVIVDSMSSGKSLALRSGPLGTQAVIGGIAMPNPSKAEVLKNKIENRCYISLQPVLGKGTLPVFISPAHSATAARPVNVSLKSDYEAMLSAYLPLINAQEAETRDGLVAKFEKKLGLSWPASNLPRKHSLHELTPLYGRITLPIVMTQLGRIVMAAMVLDVQSCGSVHDVTIFSSDANLSVQEGKEIFVQSNSELVKIGVVD
jgi:hypothetical protein